MRASIILLLLLSACVGGPDAACRLDKVVELPVRVSANVPVLDVQINGRPAALVMDTGSDATVLTRIAATRLGVAAGAETRSIGGAGGRAQVGVARLDRLDLGALRLDDVRALLGDAPRPPLDGLIGLDVLLAYELDLDVPHRRATLYRARPCATARPDWPDSTPLPVQQQAGSGHLFAAVEVDGQPLRGMLDTGASRSALSLQAAEDVRVTRRQLNALPAARGQAVNAEGVVVRSRAFRTLRLGPDTLEAPTLAIVDLPAFAGDLLIGGDYLATRRLWFSFLLGRVFVQPAQPRPR